MVVDSAEKRPLRKSSPFFGKLKSGSNKKKRKSIMSSPPVLEKDNTCAICLEDAVDAAKLDACIHVFCLTCISQWAKIKLACPYCKANFKTATLCGGKGDHKEITFDEPEKADDGDSDSDAEGGGEEYGYFDEEDEYDEDADSDFEPLMHPLGSGGGGNNNNAMDESMYGYSSDEGFIVRSDDGGGDDDDENESSYEKEDSFHDELSAAERALELQGRARRAGRNRSTRIARAAAVASSSSRSSAAGDGAAAPVMDLISPDAQHAHTGASAGGVMDLVTPEQEEEEEEEEEEEVRPIDLLKRFKYTE
jgi:hypothetical protein